MSRPLPIIFLSFLATFLISPSFSAAQQPVFDFNRAYSDYLYTYGQYRQAHVEYETAKYAYLNYQTLTSKTEAKNKTLKMLELRDEVIRTFLLATKTRFAEITKVSNYEQNVLYLKLDQEISWYASHKNSFSSAGSLEDLIASSGETQNQYQKTEILIYQTLGAILTGKELVLYEKMTQKIESLKEKIAQIREKDNKSIEVLERWLLEAENHLRRGKEKLTEAKKKITTIREYNEAQFLLEESHQYLKESQSYLGELIREIKNAN